MSVVATFPEVSRRLLPPDGSWHLASGWIRATSLMAEPTVVAAATRALLEVFTPEWAVALPEHSRQPHPFEYWYAIGGGVGMLLHLGWCLSLVPNAGRFASELRGDPTAAESSRDRFDASAAEVRGAALMIALGGAVAWVDRAQERRPAFDARFGDDVVRCEVKQLNDGRAETAYARVDGSFWEGFDAGEQAAHRRLAVPPRARIRMRPPIERLEVCANAEPLELETARAMGLHAGAAVAELLAQRPSPGDYRLDPDLEITVLSSRANDAGLATHSTSIQPQTSLYVDRVLRSIRRAQNQLATGDVGGRVVILERRWPMAWPPGLASGLNAAANRGELPDVGAVILREEANVMGAARSAESIVVIPGPRWSELPALLRDVLPDACEDCDRHHAVIDLLGWVPGRPTPWVEAQAVDESTNDAIAIARGTPPEVKLMQAIEQMSLACALQRANLRARYPTATPDELAAAFRAWQLRDV